MDFAIRRKPAWHNRHVRFAFPPISDHDLEAQLLRFLQWRIEGGHPPVLQPMLVRPQTLHALYQQPSARLVDAMTHLVKITALDISPNMALWDGLTIPSHLWGVLIATANCFVGQMHDDIEYDIWDMNTALWRTLSPAHSLHEMIAYHAVLDISMDTLHQYPRQRRYMLRHLFNLSPLTALLHLDEYMPPVLTEVSSRVVTFIPFVEAPPWDSLDEWVRLIGDELLAYGAVKTYIFQRWLEMPQHRVANRNLGLMLEALRSIDRYNADLLTFYQLYDDRYQQTDGTRRTWPNMDKVSRLLVMAHRIDPSDKDDMARSLEILHWTQELMLKFYPLVQLVDANDRMLHHATHDYRPEDDPAHYRYYRNLSQVFINTMRSQVQQAGFDRTTTSDSDNSQHYPKFQGMVDYDDRNIRQFLLGYYGQTNYDYQRRRRHWRNNWRIRRRRRNDDSTDDTNNP